MALIKCPECGKEISDKATACPNCGYPIATEENQVSIGEKDDIQENSIIEKESKEEGLKTDTTKEEPQKQVVEENREGKSVSATKSKKPLLIGALVVALLGVGIFFGTANARAYSAAMKLYDSGKYQEAANQFQNIEDYKDSSEMVKECSYQIAAGLEGDGKIKEAVSEYEKISGYKDSDDKVLQLKYDLAAQFTQSEDYQNALILY